MKCLKLHPFEENHFLKLSELKVDPTGTAGGNAWPRVVFYIQMSPFETTYTCFLLPRAHTGH